MSRVSTGSKRRLIASQTPEFDDDFLEEIDVPENLLKKNADMYFRLLHSVFNDKPISRGARTTIARCIGTADEDVMAASLKTFEESLLEEDEHEAYLRRRQKIAVAHSLFSFTDFTEPVPPTMVEAAATLLCTCIAEHGVFLRRRRFPKPNLIVSAGVRSCGALAHAVAHRMDLPYTLSNWYPDGTVGDMQVERCEGIGGMGYVYLNSVPPNSSIIILLDALYSGRMAFNLVNAIRTVEGVTVLGIYTVAEMIQNKARFRAEVAGVPHWSLLNVELDGELTTISRTTPDVSIPLPTECSPLRMMPSSTISLLKRMKPAEVQKKLLRVASTFSGVPVLYNKEVKYPYCNFALTDFKPAVEPSLVEDIADLAVHFADFTRCEVLVSEGDRGGGPMLQAISVRTNLPYVIASWILTPNSAGVKSQVTNVGFSGSHSQLSVSGLKPGMRCTLVDDMLSSGGTADAILGCIKAIGAHTVEAVFASEKLYPMEGRYLPVRKGKNRLSECFPETTITCLVQFVVRKDKTEEPPSRVDD